MRTKLRIGLLAGVLLMAPLATAIPASAAGLPLQSTEQADQVASPGCPGGAAHWSCLLESLSASGSKGK
ncbi:hypothetical protein NBRGN_057_02980 [Nocardia brasiliensis NBRC 14402]|uniref:hypothetical protein n=1 Tax=Nocardia brasiliensis TaxID=37326 RepID=UPI00030E0F24|nr:hypothetical protein [Nocardia brasiliensis]ASF11683.1 hypothetical protein CEQ30_34980 [Nocardia brasiliensis]GAJ82791.1 hypothetical protein NBRGN_057_02980 [Nocardia brasiliensis NBRC 14402]SUB09512.1 Uncharacterised protein [Nocardia brasiliensis]